MASRDLKAPQIALVAALAVVLFAVVYFLFLSGDGDTEPTAAPSSVPSPVETETPEEDEEGNGSGKAKQGPIETFEVFAARDPFEPLVDISGDGGPTTGSVPPDAAPAPGSTDGGNGSTDGSGTPGGTDGGTPTGSSNGSGSGQSSSGQTVSGHRVKLVDVFTKNNKQKAQVQVDSTVYTVNEGDTFADNFKLLSVSGQCASMLFGDDQFTLCEGEEILK